MTQEEFLSEAENYMKTLIAECKFDLEKASSVLQERFQKSKEGTLGYALNFTALEMIKPMKEYWTG